MQVHSLFYYPVKSLSGIEVNALALDDFGPTGDRRWMIVDDEGRFVTQRSRPELARVGLAIEGSRVVVTIPGQGNYPLIPGEGQRQVMVWRDPVSAVGAAPGPGEALSRYCGETLAFVYMPASSWRTVDPDRVGSSRRVSFADGYPFLVVNLASLEELGARLGGAVDIRRFRPNLVISGAEPWQEDHWNVLTIGNVRLELVKPCSRCIMTTVDPASGIPDPDRQPLRTLGTYRRTADGVIFGMNGVHEGVGPICTGDPVTTALTGDVR